MSSWRAAGLNYVNYSNIAANILRRSLKGEEKEAAAKRGKSVIRYFFWVNGHMLRKSRGNPLDVGNGGLVAVVLLGGGLVYGWTIMIFGLLTPSEGEKPKPTDIGKAKR